MELAEANGILSWLLGEWSFTREVSGERVIAGTATFTALDGGAAEYFETAVITLPGGETLKGTQRYLFRQTGDGLDVYFDPRSTGQSAGLFHRLRFFPDGRGALHAEARHQCRDDIYASRYSLPTSSLDEFTVEHEVTGPRKRYTLRTVYRRSAGAT